MPMFIRMDIYRITEYSSKGDVKKTKYVGYHWFECGKSPEPYQRISGDLIQQNGLPAGDYYYASTLDSVVDSRCPQGSVDKEA